MSDEAKKFFGNNPEEVEFMKSRKPPLGKAALSKRAEPYLIQGSMDNSQVEWQCLTCGGIFVAMDSSSDSFCGKCVQEKSKKVKKPAKVPAKPAKVAKKVKQPSTQKPQKPQKSQENGFDLRKVNVDHYIPTGSANLNAMIGGGFEWGTLNAMSGGPARGKTSTLLQIAIKCGMCGRKVIYLDGDAAGGVNRRRLEGMLEYFGIPSPKNYEKDFSGKTAPQDYINYLKGILKEHNVTIRGAHDIGSLTDEIDKIEKEKWELVIVDSLTYFYKLEATKNVGTRNTVRDTVPKLAALILKLSEYASKEWACVIYALQMKSKYDKVTRDNAADWTYENIGPDLIGHTLNVLIELTIKPTTKVITAEIIKDRGGATGKVQIATSQGGITDVVEETRRRR